MQPSARALLPQEFATPQRSPSSVVWTPSTGAERKTHGLFWSHIPKTSTTFGRTIFAYACQPAEQFANVSTHIPPQPETGSCDRLSAQQNRLVDQFALYRHMDEDKRSYVPSRRGPVVRTWYHLGAPTAADDEGRSEVAPGVAVVTLLRKPSMRIRSEFRMMMTCAPHDVDTCHAGPAVNPTPGTDWGWEWAVRSRALRALFDAYQSDPNVSETVSAQRYADALSSDNALWGCQTRMLLGYGCHESHEPTADERAYAMKLMRGSEPGVGFVGLTERYAESVCLFHAINGGSLFAFEVESHNATRASTEPASPVDSIFDGQDNDPDVQLYDLAVARFERELRAHRSDMTACLAALPAPTKAR